MRKTAVLRAYLRDRKQWFLLVLLQFFILFLVYAMYGLPLGPALYVTLIMTAVLLMFHLWEFRRFEKEVRELECLQKQSVSGLPLLPYTQDLQKQLCFALLKQSEEARRRSEEESCHAAQRMTEYYTLWSHQVKTPLAAMRLLLQEPELERHAFEQELLKTEQYVDMALQYQRLRFGSNDLVLREISLSDLVKRAVKATAALFIHQKIGIQLGSLEGTILTDEKWLGFVLEQLLTNAVKYTPKGHVSVYSQGSTLLIQDTGIGIRPEELPRIFEWGYTGYNGRGEHRSTGIGLTLCKQTLDLLGNRISICSKVGVGTTVSLDLSRASLELD